MDFAVIRICGKQFLVKPGEVIEVAASLGKVGAKLTFDEVLLVVEGQDIHLGTPLVAGKKVTGEVVFEGKGEKLDVFKFKAKSRYRRKMGFRPLLTKIKISNDEPIKKSSPKVKKKA